MGFGKAIVAWLRRNVSTASPVASSGSGGWRRILEPYAGAWQQNVTITHETACAYSTLYACLARISTDIGKLPFQLKQLDSNGLWRETTNPAYSPVLRRPNHFQTPAQFREAWILSKLIHGNTYVLKERDNRDVVIRLYVLDPCNVVPMIAESGDVYYRIAYSGNSPVAGVSQKTITIPASEVIHDREPTLHHPLIGIPPLTAAALPASKNHQILKAGFDFFSNGANPGGILTAPAGMSDTDAQAVKDYWSTNFTGPNRGRIGVIGADMKFVPLAFNAVDSQMVEQLRYSDEQIAHAFGIPPYKVGIGQIPAGLKVDDLNQMFYSDALQARIEAMEDCLDQGLGLGDTIGVELNLEPLLRMDAQKQADVEGALVKAGIKAPNEARKRFGLAPLTGGDSVYLQQQNFSLEALARRDASEDPFGTGAKALPSTPPEEIPVRYRERQRQIEHETKSRYRYDWRTEAFTYIGPAKEAA